MQKVNNADLSSYDIALMMFASIHNRLAELTKSSARINCIADDGGLVWEFSDECFDFITAD